MIKKWLLIVELTKLGHLLTLQYIWITCNFGRLDFHVSGWFNWNVENTDTITIILNKFNKISILPKLGVAGSSPVSRSIHGLSRNFQNSHYLKESGSSVSVSSIFGGIAEDVYCF